MSHNFDFASQNFNRLFDLLSQICFSVIILTKNLDLLYVHFDLSQYVTLRWTD